MELDRREVLVEGLDFSFTLLYLSDMHLSPGDEKLIEELGRTLESLKEPIHVVSLGGDFVNDAQGFALVPRLLEALPRSVPRVAVLGNHDFYQYRVRGVLGIFAPILLKARPLNVARLREILRGADVEVLEHRGVTRELAGGAIYVYGMSQPKYGHPHRPPDETPPAACAGRRPFRLLLCHRPDVPESYAQGFDLVMGGHTHGGQVRFPGIGALKTNCLVHPSTASGHFRLGSAQWIVNHGFSADDRARFRLNTPRQISLLHIQPGTPPPLKALRFSAEPPRWRQGDE